MLYTCKECNTKNSHYNNEGGFCCAFCGSNAIPLDLPTNFNHAMRKLIDLDESTFKTLSKLAIDNDTNLKSYIESVLVTHAGGGFKDKKPSTKRKLKH